MKIRKGFVSNSSSSSFIVYNREEKEVDYSQYRKYFKEEEDFPYLEEPCYSITLPLRQNGRLKSFGWEFSRRSSFEDKVNYLFLQIMELKESKYFKTNSDFRDFYYNLRSNFEGALRLLLKKGFGIGNCFLDIKIDYNALYWNSIYKNIIFIDHQSLWDEKFFYDYSSKRKPKELFFNQYPWISTKEGVLQYLLGDSYIQGGNDNEDPTEEFLESRSLLEKYMEEVKKEKDLEE